MLARTLCMALVYVQLPIAAMSSHNNTSQTPAHHKATQLEQAIHDNDFECVDDLLRYDASAQQEFIYNFNAIIQFVERRLKMYGNPEHRSTYTKTLMVYHTLYSHVRGNRNITSHIFPKNNRNATNRNDDKVKRALFSDE